MESQKIFDAFGIGRQIAILRKKNKWNQDQLAYQAGVSRPTISKAENSPTEITPRIMRKILKALDIQAVTKYRVVK